MLIIHHTLYAQSHARRLEVAACIQHDMITKGHHSGHQARLNGWYGTRLRPMLDDLTHVCRLRGEPSFATVVGHEIFGFIYRTREV